MLVVVPLGHGIVAAEFGGIVVLAAGVLAFAVFAGNGAVGLC